jgi:hypothetical protein
MSQTKQKVKPYDTIDGSEISKPERSSIPT